MSWRCHTDSKGDPASTRSPSGSPFPYNKGLPILCLSSCHTHHTSLCPKGHSAQAPAVALTCLDSSPVASTPKNSHTAGQNCSLQVMKSSSKLEGERGEGWPG